MFTNELLVIISGYNISQGMDPQPKLYTFHEMSRFPSSRFTGSILILVKMAQAAKPHVFRGLQSLLVVVKHGSLEDPNFPYHVCGIFRRAMFDDTGG